MLKMKFLPFIGLLACGACELGPQEHDLHIVSYFFDFNDGDFGWTGDFADYPVGDSLAFDLNFGYSNLPANLGTGKGLFLSGDNHSDDLFMFLKKKVTGLLPSTEYQIGFQIKFATNAPKDAVGIGGSPGESVYLKAGGSALEPNKIEQSGYYVMNIDKGNQISGGKDMVVIGNISSSSSAVDYNIESRNNSVSFKTTTSPNGELWIVVGTDSGFEGVTTLYYTEISAVFSVTD